MKFHLQKLLTVAALLGALGMLGLPTTQRVFADGATIIVNSNGDGADANLADDICETANGNGVCTLRAAIQTANRDNDTDTIHFDIPGGGVPKIQVASALPDITKPVILDGTTQASGWVELTATDYTFSANGFKITAGSSTVRGFVINGFSGAGIRLESGSGNTIVGNRIGTNVDGTASVLNYSGGVNMTNSADNQIGGSNEANRNLISGNGGDGVIIFDTGSTGNHVKGNFIGTDVTGTAAIPNVGGIGITGASNNIIGGDSENARNLISGNANYGIDMAGPAGSNVIQNNYIGTNADGTSALGNGIGVLIADAGENNQILNNVISGNSASGIELRGLFGAQVQGNFIGTTPDGASALGNGEYGIYFPNLYFHNPLVIGGDNAGEGNTIRFNTKDGIFDESTGLIRILKNRISDNGELGIDMGVDGVNENDNDEFDGTVFERNYPVLTSAQIANGETTIQGTLHSEPNSTHRLDFYRNAACDPSGNGEGDIFLGTYNTDPTDENGDLTFTATINAAAVGGEFITALNVSDGERNSEFSACVQVSGGNNNLGSYLAYDLADNPYEGGSPWGINNQGQISLQKASSGYLWFSHIAIELGQLPDAQPLVNPRGINDSAQIVGQAKASDDLVHAFVWQEGQMTQLPGISGADAFGFSTANAINNAGVIVGREAHGNAAGEDLGGAIKWSNNAGTYSATFLPSAPDCARFCGADEAHDINDAGVIVGSAAVDDYGPPYGYCCDHAARWDNGVLTMLDTDMDTDSVAQAVNENGQAVGFKRFFQQGYLTVPMLWSSAGNGTNLLSNGFDSGTANDINNNGVVVGTADDFDTYGYGHGFIWTQATGMVDLNTLLEPGSGWVIESAVGINDRGEIIGVGRYNYNTTGVLLRPSDLNNLGGAPFVVNTTGDANDNNIGDGNCLTNAGECTLRAAIQEANADADASKIYFNIPGDGIPTIAPNSELPEITKPVSIDGGTQHDCDTLPCIELAGQNTNQSDDGLVISAGDSTVRGLIINRFNIGITLKTKGGNKIQGNYIGTDASGMMRRPNHTMGIYIQNTANNVIGGTLPDSRNVISGNGSANSCAGLVDLLTDAYGQSGISIVGNNADQNIIQGNYIGTDKNGTGALYNNCLGIGISTNANLNIIGGTTPQARNLISGNLHMEGNSPQGWGIYLVSINGSPLATTIQGNYIGTDVNGASALENGKGLVVVAPQNTIGGTSAGAGNLISGNREQGIYLESFPAGTPANVGGNRVQGNLIGVDATQTQALPNNMGIEFHNQTNLLVGGTSAEAGNVISGNTTYGIFALVTNATGIRVQGNAVGTDAQGSANLGNGMDGMYIAGSPDASIAIGGKQPGAGNRIAYNVRHGVSSTNSFTGFPGTTIRGNTIFDNNGEGIKAFPDTAIPTVRSSQYSSNKLKVKGSLNGEANKTYNLDFYANASCDTGEFGEGKTYLGSKDVTTNASGNADYEFLASNVPDGTVVTATATRGGTFTGSFSRCRTMTAAASQAYAATSGNCDGNTPCYNSINEAIDAADPDGTVNIAPGTYNQDIVLNGDVNLNMGESNGGGGCCDGNRAGKKSARKGKRANAEAATDANDYILNGSLSILNGSFQAPATNLYISGNLTLQSPGNFNHNGGTVILNGSGTQHINGDFGFYNWTIHNGVFADVGDSQTYVDGTFTNNGVAQNRRTTFVDDSGSLSRFYDAANRTSARIGSNGAVELGSMQVTTTLGQSPTGQTACAQNGLASIPTLRWYEIQRVAGNDPDVRATVRLYYNASELNGALPETLKIYHCNTTTQQWEALTATRSSDSVGPYLQVTNVSSFSPFGLGGNNGAPTNVTLSKFNAKANKKGRVNLKWQTGSELTLTGFNLWRAEGAGEFAPLNAEPIAAKNPGGIDGAKYKYLDKSVSAGKAYRYRLELVLSDGTIQQSEIVKVKIPGAACGQPETPALIAPDDHTKLKGKVTLDWSDAQCGATYQLAVERIGKHKQQILDDNTLTVSEYTFEHLDKGKYKWRVRACNGNTCGDWSAWSNFSVQGKKKKAH